MISATKF